MIPSRANRPASASSRRASSMVTSVAALRTSRVAIARSLSFPVTETGRRQRGTARTWPPCEPVADPGDDVAEEEDPDDLGDEQGQKEWQTGPPLEPGRLHEEAEEEHDRIEQAEDKHVLLPDGRRRGAAGGVEPLVEARPSDARVIFLGERARLLEQLLALR